MDDDDGIDFDDEFFSTIDRLVEAHHHQKTQSSQPPPGSTSPLKLVPSPNSRIRGRNGTTVPAAAPNAASLGSNRWQAPMQIPDATVHQLRADLEKAQHDRRQLEQKLQHVLQQQAQPPIRTGYSASSAASLELQRQITGLRQQLAFKSQEVEELQQERAAQVVRLREVEGDCEQLQKTVDDLEARIVEEKKQRRRSGSREGTERRGGGLENATSALAEVANIASEWTVHQAPPLPRKASREERLGVFWQQRGHDLNCLLTAGRSAITRRGMTEPKTSFEKSTILARARALPHTEFEEAAWKLREATAVVHSAAGISTGITMALFEYANMTINLQEVAATNESKHPLTFGRAGALRSLILAAALNCLATWLALCLFEVDDTIPLMSSSTPTTTSSSSTIITSQALARLALQALKLAHECEVALLQVGDATDEVLSPHKWRPALGAAACDLLLVSLLLVGEQGASSVSTEAGATDFVGSNIVATLRASDCGLAPGLQWALRQGDPACRVSALQLLAGLLPWAATRQGGDQVFRALVEQQRDNNEDDGDTLAHAWVGCIPSNHDDCVPLAASAALESLASCLMYQTPLAINGSQLASLSQGQMLAADAGLLMPRLVSAGLLQGLAGFLLALADEAWLDSVGITMRDDSCLEGSDAHPQKVVAGDKPAESPIDHPAAQEEALLVLQTFILVHALLSHPGYGHCALESLTRDDAALRALVLSCSHCETAFPLVDLKNTDDLRSLLPPWAADLADSSGEGNSLTIGNLGDSILTLLERCY